MAGPLIERAETAGLGVAIAAHAALLWALTMARPPTPVPPPSAMEVSFVEEVGPQSAAPASEPSQSAAPELGAPEDAAPAAAEPLIPEPTQRPIPDPAASAPTPLPQRQAQPQAQPQRPPARQNGSGEAQAARRRSLAEELRPFGSDARPSARPSQPAGAVVSDQARASMDGILNGALQRCRRQPVPAPEAAAIRVRVEVILNPNGSLASARVVSVSNATGNLAIYAQRMRDLATNVVEQCVPIRGLPAEYYNVPRGWRRFFYTFPQS